MDRKIWQCVSRVKVKFTLKVKQAWTPTLPMIHDLMLMDYFVSRKFKPQQLEVLNHCRIYLQVLSLTDIVTADGKQIIIPALNGNKLTDRKSTLNWPIQQRPTKSAWKLWASALQHLHTNGTLHEPLTDWLSSPHQNCKPHITKHHNEVSLLTSSTPLPRVNSVESEAPSSLIDLLWSHKFYKHLIGPLHTYTPEIGERIAQTISSDSLLVCCDGSYSPDSRLSSHGWVIASKEIQLWKGAGPVDGHSELNSTICAELGGIVALLHVLLCICKYHNLTTGNITLYCDSQSALNKTLKTTDGDIKHHLVANYDLLHEGKTILKELQTTINISLLWIKGHYEGAEKSLPHSLNEVAHNLVHDFLQCDQGAYIPRSKVLEPPSAEVSILFDNFTLTSNLPSILRESLYSNSLRATICKNEQWTPGIFQQIDWQAYHTAFKSHLKSHRNSICKLSHKLLNTNFQNNKYYSLPDTCPCCLQNTKTFNHMLTCQETTTLANRSTQTIGLKTNLRKISTPEPMIKAILQGLQMWERKQQNSTTTRQAPTFEP
jgi:hypothetical protein